MIRRLVEIGHSSNKAEDWDIQINMINKTRTLSKTTRPVILKFKSNI